MEKETLLLKVLDKLLWNENSSTQEEESDSINIWKYVILRCRNAWVHFWKLSYAKNWIYRLKESRRLYYWTVKDKQWISLSDLAIKWLDDNNKTCALIEEIEITEKEWAEIIPVAAGVEKTFINAKIYIP